MDDLHSRMLGAVLAGDDRRRILCIGGASLEPEGEALHDYVLGLSGRPAPRVCFMPTASGDRSEQIARFYWAFGRRACEPSHISLIRHAMPAGRIESHLLDQDVVYVGAGDVLSLLAVWRAHGVDRVLRAAWEKGVVLCGSSAGSACWFEVTTIGPVGAQRPAAGLGFLPGAMLAEDAGHREARHAWFEAVRERAGPAFALDSAAAILFAGTKPSETLTANAAAHAYRLEATNGQLKEVPLKARVVEEAPHETGHSAIEEFRQVRLAQRQARERGRGPRGLR